MPKSQINYSKSVIYKIEHSDNAELLYVGSTTDFTKRKYQHKTSCNNSISKEYNYKLYKMIREHGGWSEFKMMIIKEFPCDNKIELLIEEDRQMKSLKASLNCKKAYSTEEEEKLKDKEWYELNKEKRKEQQHKLYELGKKISSMVAAK